MIVKTLGLGASRKRPSTKPAAPRPTRPASAARRSTKRRSSRPNRSRWRRVDRRSGAEAGRRRPARDAEVRVESLDELVEFFTAAGKKGVAINRYKGLGEMNPDTLWETTMNPETRTLRRSAPKITWKPT